MKFLKLCLTLLVALQIAGCDTSNSQQTQNSEEQVIALQNKAVQPVTYPAWDKNTIYNGGEKVTHANHNWEARWWTQGQEPGTTGEWGVWKDLGPVSEDTQAPSNVTGIKVDSVTHSSVNLSWLASTDNIGVAGYKIYNGATLVMAVKTTNATITGLAAETAYTFGLAAFDAAGNESTPTKILATTGKKIIDIEAPSVPTNLKLDSVTSNSATVSWTASLDNIGPITYMVFVDGAYKVTVSTTSATIDNLSANSTYAFSVCAVDEAANQSAQTAALNVTTNAQPSIPLWKIGDKYKVGDKVLYDGSIYRCTYAHEAIQGWEPPQAHALWANEGKPSGPPQTPAALKAKALSTSAIKVSFNSADFATSYELDVDGVVLKNVTSPYEHTGLLKNSTHTYKVRALNTDGASKWSTVVSATTLLKDPPPSVPTGLKAKSAGATQITVSWDVVTGMSYDLKVDGAIVANATSPYQHTGLIENSTHTYSVAAKNTNGTSAFSASVSAKATSNIVGPYKKRTVVGYWETWNATIHSAGHIHLNDVHPDYNVLCVAFPVINPDGTVILEDGKPSLDVDVPTPAEVAQAQAAGRKILISIGGAEAVVDLTSATQVTNFVNSCIQIIEFYGFNGIDIDIEHGLTGAGSPAVPSASQAGLIDAINRLCAHFGPDFMLTMAPETAYVVGGIGSYGGPWGAYLPVIDAVRDKLTYIHMQYYNSGGMMGLDGKSYTSGTVDFLVALTDAMIQGFDVAQTGWHFKGLKPSQVAIGLPAINGAAPSGGYVSPANVHKALDTLIKGVNNGGYMPKQTYSNLRGVMTWSANWDCSNGYEFVNSHAPYMKALGDIK